MQIVNDWIATRSGASMTITGRASSESVRFTGIDQIKGQDGATVALRGNVVVAELRS